MKKASYFESVQYLRGIAAFLVLLAHMPAGLPWAWNGAFRGGIGVDLFFIISGFVMALTIEHEGESGPRAAWNFALRRAVRILPMYAIATLALAGVSVALGDPIPSLGYLLGSVSTYPLSDSGGAFQFPYLFLGWSLSYEMFFYLILIALISLKRATWPLVAAVLFALVGAGWALKPSGVLASFVTAPILLEFALGFFAYTLWMRSADWFRSHAWFRWTAFVVFLVALKGFDGDSVGAMPKMIVTYFGTAASWRCVGWGLPSFAFFLGVLSFEGRFHPRSQASLKTLGDISYSLYLFHMPVIHLLVPLLGVSWFVLTFAYLAIPVFVAWVLYRWLEKPVVERLRFLGRGARPAVAAR